MAITKATASSIAPAAKGDLVVGSATNDAAVLGVGSNDQVLTADSAEATGLKWATPTGMTNPLTTTGDTIYSSSGTTPARLGIGSTGDVLTVAGGVPSWAAPASGALTLLSTTTLSGANTSVSGISASYKNLVIWIRGAYASGASQIFIAPDGNTPCLAVKMSGTSVANQTSIATPDNVGTAFSNITNNSYFRLQNYADATYGKAFQWYGVSSNSGNASFLVTGVWNYATSVNYMEFYVAGIGVTWQGGQVLIYGEN